MRKFNKILMMIVSILLTFVLISSCILSGTMAKFVVSKDATTTATLEAFGVTLTIGKTTGTGGGLSGATISSTRKGTTLTYKLNNVSIKPGDIFHRALSFNFSSSSIPSVDARITIKTEIEYDPEDFKIVNGAGQSIGGTTGTTYFMPLGFTLCWGHSTSNATFSENYYMSNPWKSSTSAITGNSIENTIASTMYSKFTVPSGVSKINPNNTNAFSMDYPTGSKIQFKLPGSTGTNRYYFHMGFAWPDEPVASDKNANYDYDVLATYLADNAPSDAKFNITYIVSVEQK